jgi:hypothetical protein
MRLSSSASEDKILTNEKQAGDLRMTPAINIVPTLVRPGTKPA